MAAEGVHGHRVAGLGQGVQLAGAGVVAQRHEQPVVAVCVGPASGRPRPAPRRCRPCRSTRRGAARATGRTAWPSAARRWPGLSRPRHPGAATAAARRAAGLAAADARSRSDMADAAPSSPSTSAPASSRHQTEQRQGRGSARRCRAGSRRSAKPSLGRQGGKLAARVGDDGEAGLVGVSLPRPGQVAAGPRGWSPTGRRRRAPCGRPAAQDSRPMAAGSVVSSTCSAGAPPGSPAPAATTSGNRLDPPMPASSTRARRRRPARSTGRSCPRGGRSCRAPRSSTPTGRRSRSGRGATACDRRPRFGRRRRARPARTGRRRWDR